MEGDPARVRGMHEKIQMAELRTVQRKIDPTRETIEIRSGRGAFAPPMMVKNEGAAHFAPRDIRRSCRQR